MKLETATLWSCQYENMRPLCPGNLSNATQIQTKVCPIENNTNLNSIFCLIKSLKIDFIFLPAFYLIMWLMASPNNFEKITILKK